MSFGLQSLVKATRNPHASLSNLLPVFRQAVLDDDVNVRAFVVDSILLRASVSHVAEWERFVEQLQAGDEYIRAISWLGHYLGPMVDVHNTSDFAGEEMRRQFVLCLVEHYPESRIHQRIQATMNRPGDETAYDIAKSLWLKSLLDRPDSVDIVSNAAHFLRVREPALSRGLLSACAKTNPHVNEWHRGFWSQLSENGLDLFNTAEPGETADRGGDAEDGGPGGGGDESC